VQVSKRQKNKSAVIEKFDHLVASSEKLFHFRQHSANDIENLKVKPTSSKPSVVSMNWNLVENPQENDKTASYFTKLSFANRSAKEKKLLGSPRLHRAIFGNRNHHESANPVDHEVFLPLTFTKNPSDSSTLNNGKPSNIQAAEMTVNGAQSSQATDSSSKSSANPSLELEYPPTFEAEIYSLSDLSSNLLKRRHQKLDK